MSKVPGNNLLLYNARLIRPGEVIERGAIVIEDGSIAAIQTVAESLRYGGERVDLNGATVYPGFIDVHIHGAIGVDTMAASASDLNRVSLFLASRGVTGWLPTLVPAPSADYARAVGAIAEAADISGGARILGVHYEGPFVNSDQCGALRSQFFRSYSGNADVADLPILKPKSAKHMMTVAPEIDGGVALVADLTRHGWVVAVGHTRADFKVLDHAFAAGARHMTHFMNAMTPLHHRAPGPVGWGLLRPDVTCDLIADGVHLDPEMLRLLLKVKTADRLALISDAVAAAGSGDGEYEIWGETITVKAGRTSNARGAIAGSVITMMDAVRMMLSLGASESEVARMAANNPARLLGIDQECGSIEEGKRADLVAVDSNMKVVLAVVGGKTVKSSEK